MSVSQYAVYTPLISEDGTRVVGLQRFLCMHTHYDAYVAASLHDDKSTQEFLALNALQVLEDASTCSCALLCHDKQRLVIFGIL